MGCVQSIVCNLSTNAHGRWSLIANKAKQPGAQKRQHVWIIRTLIDLPQGKSLITTHIRYKFIVMGAYVFHQVAKSMEKKQSFEQVWLASGCQWVGMPVLSSSLSTYWPTKWSNQWWCSQHTSDDQTPIPCVPAASPGMKPKARVWRANALAFTNRTSLTWAAKPSDWGPRLAYYPWSTTNEYNYIGKVTSDRGVTGKRHTCSSCLFGLQNVPTASVERLPTFCYYTDKGSSIGYNGSLF